MMTRTPSARELRRELPSNVAMLPTAAPKQVHQPWNKETRAAKRALCSANPWPGEFIHSSQREAIKRAEAINSVKKTPALRIALAILASLDAETLQRVATRLAVETLSGSDEAKQASAIADCVFFTPGQRVDLDFAFKWIAERDAAGGNFFEP